MVELDLMRDRLIALLQESSVGVKESEWLADSLLLDGVIVPPCKVGDAVWFELYGQIESATIYHCTYESSHKGLFLSDSYAKDTRGLELSFCGNSIGKTVFLTREEAEQALKGGE